MIKLICIMLLHLVTMLVINVALPSKTGKIATDDIPGYEVCAGNARAGFDRDCMHRNSDRIGKHVQLNPPPVMESQESPILAPIVALLFSFWAWSIALKPRSRTSVCLVSGGYAFAAILGVIGLMEVLAIVLAASAAIGARIFNARRGASLRADS